MVFEASRFSAIDPIASLIVISFISFLGGYVFRKWPEKVQEFALSVDGSLLLMTPEMHRAAINVCGLGLLAMSGIALLATGGFV